MATKQDYWRVSSSDIIDAQGQVVRMRGLCLGGWMNMENFITGYAGSESQQRRALRQRGHTVGALEDGAAAIAAVQAGAYDCLILDMHMPVVTGTDVMRAIRRMEAADGAPRMPIIALTADVIPDHVRSFLNAGADAVIGKPVDWGMLDEAVRKLAGRSLSVAKSA